MSTKELSTIIVEHHNIRLEELDAKENDSINNMEDLKFPFRDTNSSTICYENEHNEVNKQEESNNQTKRLSTTTSMYEEEYGHFSLDSSFTVSMRSTNDNNNNNNLTTSTGVIISDSIKNIGVSMHQIVTRATIVENAYMTTRGDTPAVLYFAQEKQYWKIIFFAMLTGIVMAVVLLTYDFILKLMNNLWITCDFNNNIECGLLYHGQLYWIGSVALCGFVVGSLRWILQYPDHYHSLYHTIEIAEGDTKWSPVALLLQLISMGFGATIGPEAGLAAFGAAVSQFFINKYCQSWSKNDQKLLVLAGVACAMNSLFVTPVLASLFIFELSSRPPRKYLEFLLVLGFASFVSYYIFYPINILISAESYYTDITEIEAYFVAWVSSVFELRFFVSIAIGLVGASVSVVIYVGIIISRRFFEFIRSIFYFNAFLRSVVPPIIGGAIIGTINYILPLTIGTGKLFNVYLIKFGNTEDVPIRILVGSLICKLFLLGISNTCGFKGGLFLPMVNIGYACGIITSRLFPNSLSVGFYVGCFMAAVPSAMSPTPLTWALYPTLSFFFGPDQSVPFFVAATVSYLSLSVTGAQDLLSPQQPTQSNNNNINNHSKQNLDLNKDDDMYDEIIIPDNNL